MTLRLSVRPQLVSSPIDNLMIRHELPELHSAITLFVRNGISGAFPHRDDYPRDSLPPEYNFLDVWHHIRFNRDALNEFCAPDARLLRCKPPDYSKSKPAYFDPILVNVQPQNDEISSKLFDAVLSALLILLSDMCRAASSGPSTCIQSQPEARHAKARHICLCSLV